MKLQYDEPLSNFAFNFNLRRWMMEGNESLQEMIDALMLEEKQQMMLAFQDKK